MRPRQCIAKLVIPVYLESDEATLRLGSPGNNALYAMTSEEKADAKKLAHAPPVYLESDQATFQLGSPGNDDLNPMTYFLAMTSREDEHVQNHSHMPPDSPDPYRANPGAFRIGGQDNDDGNTITSEEEARSDGVTSHIIFQVSARLVEDDPEDNRREPIPEISIAVAVAHKKRFMYILMGVSVISVIVAIVLGVTLSSRSSQSGTTPAPALTPSQRDSVITLIQSRSAASNSSSPQSQALDWMLADPFSSNELSDRTNCFFARAWKERSDLIKQNFSSFFSCPSFSRFFSRNHVPGPKIHDWINDTNDSCVR